MEGSSCHQCGFSNPNGFAYCGRCGAPLSTGTSAAAPLEGERRLVVILFADLSGYTTLSEVMDAEEVRDLMNQWYSGLSRIVHDHGGYVDKYIGDCLMALFGAPRAHEDDPERAARTALAMQVWTNGFAQSLGKDTPSLRVRIGIHMGEVVAGGVGGKERSDYSVMGDAVNVASRLESSADPGTILVSESVYARTHYTFQYDGPRSLKLKGKTLPVNAYRLLKEEIRQQSPHGLTGPLIDRQNEIETLRRHLDASARGQGRMVHIVGEAGLGKTRLLYEILGSLPKGIKSWQVTCHPHQQEIPYAVFRALLPEITPRLSQAPGWAEWSPYLRVVLSPDESFPDLPELDLENRQRLIHQALLWTLQTLAREGPVLLCLDNYHWSDSATRALLKQFYHDIASFPLCLMISHRPVFLPDAPQAYRIPLRPLSPDSSKKLLENILPSLTWEPDLKQAVLSRSNGNPLYIEETVRSLIETGVIVRETDRWICHAAPEIPIPETLHSLLMARIDHLNPPARRWLIAASVQGVQISTKIVDRMFEHPPTAPHPISELIQTGHLKELPEADAFRFTQTLIQEVAYQSILRSNRRRYHARVGDALEQHYAGSTNMPIEVLAYHFDRSEDTMRAMRYTLLAGERTLSFYDAPAAIRYFTQAIAHAGKLDDRHAADQAERTARAYLCEIYLTTGRFHDALIEGQAVLKALPNDNTHAGEAARAHRLIGLVHTRQGDPLSADPWFHDALSLLKGHDSPDAIHERIRILLDRAFAAYRRGAYAQAGEAISEGLRWAEEGKHSREEAQAYHIQGLIAYAQGARTEAHAVFDRSLKLREGIGDLPGMGSTFNMLGNLCRDDGTLSKAEQHFSEAVRLWEKIGDVTQMAGGLNNLANLLAGKGDFIEAEHLYQKTLDLAERHSDYFARAMARTNLGHLALEMDNIRLAQEYLSLGMEEARRQEFLDLLAYLLCGIGECALRDGDHSAAKEAFKEALSLSLKVGHKHQEAMALRGLGKALSVSGAFNDAAQHLTASLTLFQALQRKQEEARTCLALADLYQGTRKAKAKTFLSQARVLFENLKAVADLKKLTAMEKTLGHHTQ